MPSSKTFTITPLLLLIASKLCSSGSEDDYPAETTTISALFAYEKPDSTSASEVVQEDEAINEGKESEETFPEGFDIVDGVLMDITNVLVQQVVGDKTEYRPYQSNNTDGTSHLLPDLKYSRAKEEAGWHFVLFEDPDEDSGSGNMILLQKLTGFTVGVDRVASGSDGLDELRLYQAFHIKLGDEFEDEEDAKQSSEEHPSPSESTTQAPTETMRSDEDDSSKNPSSIVNPYDNAELVSTGFENQALLDKIKNETEHGSWYRGKKHDHKRLDAVHTRMYHSSETVVGDDHSEEAQRVLHNIESETTSATSPVD